MMILEGAKAVSGRMRVWKSCCWPILTIPLPLAVYMVILGKGVS